MMAPSNGPTRASRSITGRMTRKPATWKATTATTSGTLSRPEVDRKGVPSVMLPAVRGLEEGLRTSPAAARTIACAAAPLLPLPACHQGVYARLRRAMERVGVRGRFHTLRLAETPLTRNESERRAHSDLSPQAGRGEGRAVRLPCQRAGARAG